jgi:hypothetical protein
MSTVTIDLSLTNTALYAGCTIETVAGRANLLTAPTEAVNIVGGNIVAMLEAVPRAERGSVTITGPMAVWSYLIVFHAVVHAFSEVVYEDGRNPPITIARHGAAPTVEPAVEPAVEPEPFEPEPPAGYYGPQG